MKSKFSSMWRVGIALVLALSLSMVMAVPVSAAVSEPEVTVEPADPADATAVYTIEFITNEDLEAGDGIVIEFPEGTGGLGSITTSDVAVDSVTVDSVDNVDERLSITLGAALDAGDITVVVGNGNDVTNPADGDYTLDVYTSQEPTAVTSETYMISLAVANIGAPNLTLDTVALAADYDITFDISEAMRDEDDIVIEFPVDTDISTVVKEDVTVDDVDGDDPAVDSISIDGQVLTITLGGDLLLGPTKVTIANHIINPTTVLNPDPYEENGTVDADDLWRLTVYNSHRDRIPTVSDTYTLNVSAPGTDVSQIVWSTVDEYVSNDTVSTVSFVIETQDQYGNPAVADDTDPVTFDLTASSGAFYSESACTNVITTIDIDATESDSGTNDLYYKGATAETVTITADEVEDEGWTVAEDTILVNPELELWGGGQLKDSYATFALAMTDALPYDTIKVAPSTYDGGITVDVSYLTIESTGTAAETIIDIEGSSGPTIDITAIGVTVDDFTVTVNEGEQAIRVAGADATVKNNVITLVDPPGWAWGIWIHGHDQHGAIVEDNELAQVTMMVNSVSNVELSDNVFGAGINLVFATDIRIIDNEIIGSEGAGIVFEGNTAFEDILIESNTISATTLWDTPWSAAIAFDGGPYTVTNLQIIYNDIIDNLCPGIVIPSTITLTTPVIMYNDISGNGGYGIDNDTGADVTARYNWWGDVTGPSTDPYADPDATPTAYGEGDAISADVTYTPWLAVSQSVCVPATSSRYAIEIPLTHVASYSAGTWSGGWNTFSTPIWLHGDGDTWGDIVALINLDAAMVYGWDGTNWIAPFPSTTVITPLDAILVQMKEEARLPILFSTQLQPAATKDLSAGWNLIGMGSLDDTMTRDVVLASLGVDTTAKYSQVIDPISGDVLGDTAMGPGMGYWIFMKEAGTLAGFECTPQPWVLVE